ncbi:unnamed protein product, partial [Mesorhabditis spiculigera]
MASEDDDETKLAYYHGHLLDEDADKLLKDDGDYLLHCRFEKGQAKPRYCLVVRAKEENRRYMVKRSEKGFKITGHARVFTSILQMMDHFISKGIDDHTLDRPIGRSKFQLHHKDIRLVKKLGAGAYGTVYKGVLVQKTSKAPSKEGKSQGRLSRSPAHGSSDEKVRKTVAVKRIESEGTDEQALTDMMKEARVMQLYFHNNIVKFYGYIIDRKPYLLVMEYCDGGSVEDRLRDDGDSITIPTRIDWTHQGSIGLEYLHSKNCIHRDIATRNCLIHQNALKLADFGMCRHTAIYKVDLSKALNVRWLAPEVWKTGETKPCTDVYAFGVMIWELFEIPYNSPYASMKAGQVKQKVMQGYRMKPQDCMPKEMADVLALAWHHKPERRPTASELRLKLRPICKKYCPNIELDDESGGDEKPPPEKSSVGSQERRKEKDKGTATAMPAAAADKMEKSEEVSAVPAVDGLAPCTAVEASTPLTPVDAKEHFVPDDEDRLPLDEEVTVPAVDGIAPSTPVHTAVEFTSPPTPMDVKEDYVPGDHDNKLDEEVSAVPAADGLEHLGIDVTFVSADLLKCPAGYVQSTIGRLLRVELRPVSHANTEDAMHGPVTTLRLARVGWFSDDEVERMRVALVGDGRLILMKDGLFLINVLVGGRGGYEREETGSKTGRSVSTTGDEIEPLMGELPKTAATTTDGPCGYCHRMVGPFRPVYKRPCCSVCRRIKEHPEKQNDCIQTPACRYYREQRELPSGEGDYSMVPSGCGACIGLQLADARDKAN